MRYLLLYLFILSCSFSDSTAQTDKSSVKDPVTPASPESVGMSSDRLKRLDDALSKWASEKRMSGGTALVLKEGKIVYYKAFGYNNVEKKDKMKVDDIFRIASQTKAITSVAVMMLYEEGKFLLDDPVSNYIPEFSKPQVLDKFNEADSSYTTVPAKSEITIRQLLTHTSGIGYAQIGSKESNAIYAKAGVTGGIGVEPGRLLATDMKKLGKLPLMHQPGEKFTYGLNTDVLGYLVEVISGMSLDEFFRKRIFEPLGMKDTYFYLPKNKHSRMVEVYDEDNGKLTRPAEKVDVSGLMIRDYPKTKGTYYSGGAGLSSTVMDYGLFLQMMLNGGELNGVRLLAPNTVRMMTMNQIGDLNLGSNKFGLGFGITTEKGSSIIPTPEGTFDWGGYFSTTYWVDPKEKLVGLFFRQLWNNTEGDASTKFKVLVYQAVVD